MKNFIKSVLTFSFILLLAACNNESTGLPAQGGDGGNNGGDNSDHGSLIVDPANPSLSTGETIEIDVINQKPDGSETDVTNEATITSSNPDIIAVGPDGELTGLSEGESELTIQYGDLETTVTVIVGPAKVIGLEVLSNTRTSIVGLEVSYVANGLYSDGSKEDVTKKAEWKSSEPTVAAITDHGLVETLSSGTATISAEWQKQQASSVLKVTSATIKSIEVDPAVISALPIGTTQQITVTGILSDGSSQDVTKLMNWSSKNNNVATVDDNGLVTGVTASDTEILVSTPSDIGDFTTNISVTVTTATAEQLTISPAIATIAKGVEKQFTVSANFNDDSKGDVTDSATWTSSAPDIVSVDDKGLVTGLAKGTAIITASFGSKQATANIMVSDAIVNRLTLQTQPTSPISIAKGGVVQTSVIATYSDGISLDVTDQATLTPDDIDIASIIEGNNIYAQGLGSTQVIARFDSKDSQPIDITVTNATVSDINFEPENMNLIVGTTGKFTATATFSDNTQRDITDEVIWQSSAPLLVSVDQTGLVEAIAVTTGTDITASYGGQSRDLTVVVESATLESINVTPKDETIGVGEELQFKAIGSLSNNTVVDITNDVTWTSSDISIAQINSDGLAEAKAQGMAGIIAEFNTVKSTAANIVVGPAVPQKLHINFKTKGIDILGLIQINVGAGGDLFTLSSELFFSDGSSEEPSANEVQYISSNDSLISIGIDGTATLVSAEVIGSSEIKGIYTDVTTLETIESENLVSVECLSQVHILLIGLGLACDIESIDNPDVD